MAIPFLAEIEKLITEHGSAAILRERIALANDKYATLERKVGNLESEAADLKRKVSELEAENKGLRVNKKELESELQQFKDSKLHGSRLEELKEKILVAISQEDGITTSEIARLVSISKTSTEVHLDELLQASLAKPILRANDQESPWVLNQAGKKYLVQHGLA